MCAIAGFCNVNHDTFILDSTLLERMQQSMAHRGPDGSGTWTSCKQGVGLTHRRLSIIDLSDDAAQPMHDPQEHIVVSFNGEIYNYKELRTQLKAAGYHFRTKSDTEVLIYGYHAWGFHEMLNRLDGMFAIVLFDRIANKLFCARDRIGIKPFYFSVQSGIFSFASEIKALWCLPWMQKTINQNAAYHYLTYLASPAPLTLFEGVYKLPPGHSIVVDEYRRIAFHRWYYMLDTIKQRAYNYGSEVEVQQHVHTFLESAVQKRMIADVPFGVFLSGGIDSSVVTALMARHTDRVNTFTVAFSDGPEYDELAHARRIVKEFNTNHHEIIINEKHAFECYQKLVHHQDEPLGDSVCVPLYYVSQLLKQSGVTVVQVGEGSDELFCGYDQYVRSIAMNRMWRASQMMIPPFAKRFIHHALSRRYPRSINHLDVVRNWKDGRSLFHSGAVVFSELWKQKFCTQQEEQLHDPIVAALVPAMNIHQDSYAVADYYRDELRSVFPRADHMQIISYLELKHRLAELLLMRVDKMTMAHAVEARVPFLDHALVEYVLGMPMTYKYRKGTTKYILKKVCEDLIPHDVIHRKKMGFAAPTTRWYKQGKYFVPFLQSLMEEKQSVWSEMLDFAYINQMIAQNQKGAVDYSYQLWAIQNLLACDL